MTAQIALHKLHKQPSCLKEQMTDTDLQKHSLTAILRPWYFSRIWEAAAIPGPAGFPAKGGDL